MSRQSRPRGPRIVLPTSLRWLLLLGARCEASPDCADTSAECAAWAKQARSSPRWPSEPSTHLPRTNPRSPPAPIPPPLSALHLHSPPPHLRPSPPPPASASQGECTNNPSYMLSSCRASCGKCGPSSGSQKGAQKPTEVLRDDAYSLHAGSVSGAGRHLHSGMYTLVDARAYCDGKEQCGGFSVDLPEPQPLPAGAHLVKFWRQVDSVVADVARATFRKEKGRGGETSGGDAGGYAKRREAMVAAYYVATAEEFAGASKHQVPGERGGAPECLARLAATHTLPTRRFQAVVEQLRAALLSGADRDACYVLRAHAYLGLGNVDNCKRDVGAVLRSDPEHGAAKALHRKLKKFGKGLGEAEQLEQARQWAAAADKYSAAAKLFDSPPPAGPFSEPSWSLPPPGTFRSRSAGDATRARALPLPGAPQEGCRGRALVRRAPPLQLCRPRVALPLHGRAGAAQHLEPAPRASTRHTTQPAAPPLATSARPSPLPPTSAGDERRRSQGAAGAADGAAAAPAQPSHTPEGRRPRARYQAKVEGRPLQGTPTGIRTDLHTPSDPSPRRLPRPASPVPPPPRRLPRAASPVPPPPPPRPTPHAPRTAQVLGVSRSASARDIKRKYHELARKWRAQLGAAAAAGWRRTCRLPGHVVLGTRTRTPTTRTRPRPCSRRLRARTRC